MDTEHKKPSPLRLARVAAGMRMADLAAVVDRDVSYIHRLEVGGSAVVRVDDARRIADALDVPVEKIFERRR